MLRTILPLTFSAHMYLFTAVSADRRIWHVGFWMLVPPFHSTGIGAEASILTLTDIKKSSALRTPSAFNLSSKTCLPATIRLYRIFGKPKLLCNLYISDATLSHGSDLYSLLICHEIVLQSENSCPHYPLEKKKPIVQKMSKKIMPTGEISSSRHQ